jgi:hypothetical protein
MERSDTELAAFGRSSFFESSVHLAGERERVLCATLVKIKGGDEAGDFEGECGNARPCATHDRCQARQPDLGWQCIENVADHYRGIAYKMDPWANQHAPLLHVVIVDTNYDDEGRVDDVSTDMWTDADARWRPITDVLDRLRWRIARFRTALGTAFGLPRDPNEIPF